MARQTGLEHFKLPRWNDLPSIDLYLDQVLSLLEEYLGEYLELDGKKVMTKTMINNYVKQKYLKAPVNKKYDRFSVASLFVIAILKPVYTIEEISKLIKLSARTAGAQTGYDQFCDYIEQGVRHAFEGTVMPKEPLKEDRRWILWNVCNSFACQLYARKVYLQSNPKKK